MSNKIAHLDMLQRIISRLASNSFLIKGWSTTLVAALFALSAKDAEIRFVYLAYFPAISFWLLDGYYLWQERLYRNLYKKVADKNECDIDFSMTIESTGMNGWAKSFSSFTVAAFHTTIVLSVIIVMCCFLFLLLQRLLRWQGEYFSHFTTKTTFGG